ncbi:hypothetical protein PY365_24770 [Roseiarcaceae bacterium H3SJ34-1]|nr:hypothetical protein [Roseiarcaceae bacterium H3SJ34-1]
MAGEERSKRGYFLEDFLNRAFDLHSIPATRAFRRNEGGEQIDGAFELDGWHYIVECRWRAKLSDIAELDSLYGKIGRSGKETMGLFLSINGWSGHVVRDIHAWNFAQDASQDLDEQLHWRRQGFVGRPCNDDVTLDKRFDEKRALQRTAEHFR